MREQSDNRNPVEVLAEEFLERRRCGEPVRIEDYAAAHPELESEIRSLFPTMMAFEDFKVCRLSSSGRALDVQIDALHQLGDFRIIREIGRGGMGVVYEAEQESLGRRVAVKVIPPQSLSGSTQLDRFHREARMAASLHHTNIVPVFGVGEQDGLHYYVMQRIRGVTLDDVISGAAANDSLTDPELTRIDTAELRSVKTVAVGATGSAADAGAPVSSKQGPVRPYSPDDWKFAADVGIQVADALAYAHEQGVLHQDVKPGNLLLDPHGTVWVTDFGLATLLTSEEIATPENVAGTLRFMAPEQLSGRHDARSDIYSLGVTLYEVISRQPAFPKESRTKTIHRILQGDVAPLQTLRPDIPRDLEAIVRRAMAGDASERYENAGALSADLRRFLDGRPVNARRTTSAHRVWRWTRRNPVVATLLTSLFVGAVLSFFLISREWRTAVAESRRAEGNLSLALESMNQILERFTSGWMSHPTPTLDQDGETAVAAIEIPLSVSHYSASVLEEAVKFYDRFAEQNAANPQLKRDTARVHRRVGDIYQRIGQYAKAEQAYQRSLITLTTVETADATELLIEQANVLNQLGLLRHATSRFDAAEAEFRHAIEKISELSRGGRPEAQVLLAKIHNNLGQSLWLQLRYGEARSIHQHAIQILEELVRAHPQDADYRLSLARAYRIYYPFAAVPGRRNGGAKIRSIGITILEELVREFPGVPDYQCELSEMLVTSTHRTTRFHGSNRREEDLNRAVDLARQLHGAHSSIPRYRAVLARALRQRGRFVRLSGPETAAPFFQESVAVYRSLVQEFPEVPTYHLFLASALRDHAGNLRQIGMSAESLELLEEAIAVQQTYIAFRPDNSFGQNTLVRMQAELTAAVNLRDDADNADGAYEYTTNSEG